MRIATVAGRVSAALLVTLVASVASAEMTPSQTARVLAGLPAEVFPDQPERAQDARTYARKVARDWENYEERLGGPMVDWAAEHLSHEAGETIFYPFAGADFFTVHRLYPAAHRYVMVALQPAGRVPDLEGMEDERYEELMKLFLGATSDFARRGYFITTEMNDTFGDEESPVEGITPMLMLMAEREGYEVLSVEPLTVNADGSAVEVSARDRANPRTWESVRLNLRRRADDVPVTLDYLQLNLSDYALDDRDADRAWVEQIARHRVVLKAASHLMQKAGFETIRDALLDGAITIVQDETAIPYDKLIERFEVELFGRFNQVHTVFPEAPHESLVEAYAALPRQLDKLPFRYGYHKPPGYAINYAHARRR